MPAATSTPVVAEWTRAQRVGLFTAIASVYAVLVVLLVFVTPGLFGFNTYTGIGTSMGDTIPDGSLIVTRTVPAEQVEVGDVIAFRWPNFEHPITHRVIDIGSQGGSPVFVTQGDGNRSRDPFLAAGTQEIGRVIFTVPRAGTWLPYIKALVYLLAFAGGFVLWRRHRQRRLAARGPA